MLRLAQFRSERINDCRAIRELYCKFGVSADRLFRMCPGDRQLGLKSRPAESPLSFQAGLEHEPDCHHYDPEHEEAGDSGKGSHLDEV